MWPTERAWPITGGYLHGQQSLNQEKGMNDVQTFLEPPSHDGNVT